MSSDKEIQQRRWKKSDVVSVIVVLVALVLLANALIRPSYTTLSPGELFSSKELAFIEGADKNSGDYFFPTVSTRESFYSDFAFAKIRSGFVMEKNKEFRGDLSEKEVRTIAVQDMTDSRLIATKLAFETVGKKVTLMGQGAEIVSVADESPAKGIIAEGDVITAVDGSTVGLASEAVTLVSKRSAGSDILLKLASGGEVTIKSIGRPDGQDVAYLGLLLRTKDASLDTAEKVNYPKTDIGGPSAGLAQCLSLLDQLTPGNLAGENMVVATGTINSVGEVGEVGGMEQKAIAVKYSGKKLFLVPKSEVDEAKKYAGQSINVIGVDTLDEALAALGANGGDVSGITTTTQRAA